MGVRNLDYGKVRSFWNERAGTAGRIDPRSITFFCEEPEALEFRDRREKDLFDERVPLQGTEKVLEVGCGSGRWTSFLAGRCRRLVGFDFAKRLVELNREAAGRAGFLNVSFEVSDVLRLDLAEKDFDLVVCFGVSLYFNDGDLRTAFENLARHMKRGGVLLSKEPTATKGRIEKIDEFSEGLGGKYSCIYRPREELEANLASAGFRKEWSVPVFGKDEPLAPQRGGIETWFTKWLHPS